jgi:hypothetical protein
MTEFTAADIDILNNLDLEYGSNEDEEEEDEVVHGFYEGGKEEIKDLYLSKEEALDYLLMLMQ